MQLWVNREKMQDEYVSDLIFNIEEQIEWLSRRLTLRPGDVIDVMTPSGRFFTELDPENAKSYVCVAAGSGITPVLSIVSTTLEVEPQSRVTLIYANRTHASVMFLEEVEDLKDRYPDRFSLVHVLSCTPGNTIPFRQSDGRFFDQTYQSR